MNSGDEERLRTVLNDAVPYLANPRRMEQIRHRVRIARRRRVLITTTTAAAAVAVAAVITPTLLHAGRDMPAASSALSWNPASVITPDFLQRIANNQSQGWQEVPGFPAKNGPKMVFFYEPNQDATVNGNAKLDGSCSSDASAPASGTGIGTGTGNSTTDSSACSVTAQELQALQGLQSGEALVLYGPLNNETSADDIRAVVPVEEWCSQIGGTDELRAATPADQDALHGGYACLDNATADVTSQSKQGLTVGYLPHSPYVFGSGTQSGS